MPMILNHRIVRVETRTPFYEQKVTEFLYDEGPSTTSQVSEYLELGVDQTRVILNGLQAAGHIRKFRRRPPGAPPKSTRTFGYWILASDW